MNDEKVMSLVYDENRDKVVSAYIDGNDYVIELDEAWRFTAKCAITDCQKYEEMPYNLIRLPVSLTSGDAAETVEFQTKYIALYGVECDCPSCGLVGYVRIQKGDNGKLRIGCKQCGLWFDYMFDVKYEALVAWNARQPSGETNGYRECRLYDRMRELKGLPKIERAEDVGDAFSRFCYPDKGEVVTVEEALSSLKE